MKRVKRIFNFAYTDFSKRIRHYSFLIIVVLNILMGVLFAPPDNFGFIIMDFGHYRNIYNSEWLGCGFALVTSMFLSLVGFYYVKKTIRKDKKSIVDKTISITSVTKFEYYLGRALSNFMLLFIILLVMIIDAGVTQLIKGEDINIKILDLVLPFLYSTLPVIIIVASLAVIFERTSLIKNRIGNVIYFFIWVFFIHEMCFMHGSGLNKLYFDLLGGNFIIYSIMNIVQVIYSCYDLGYKPYFHLDLFVDNLIIGIILNIVEDHTNYSGTLYFTLLNMDSTSYAYVNQVFQVNRIIKWSFSIFAYRYLWVVAAVFILFAYAGIQTVINSRKILRHNKIE